MFRHIIMPVIAILLVSGFSGCRSNSAATFHAPEDLNFNEASHVVEGPTRITWPDRQLTFYPLSSTESGGKEFMMVDLMGDRSIEYILRNDRLEEARFSLQDGSLVRFDLVGLQENGSEVIVYHCTPHSNAFYEMSSLPENLANRIAGFNSRFARWNNRNSGTLHCGDDRERVPFERIIKSVCCGAEMI